MGWTIIESRALTQSEMLGNAQEITNYFVTNGYTKNAIIGILANMGWESSCNPGRWQSDRVGNWSGGFGLVQWTPSTNYINWATANGYERTNPMGQLYWINNLTQSTGQWIITSSYPISWNDFKKTSNDIEWCVKAFMYNFERPGIPHLDKRLQLANLFEQNIDFSGAGCLYTPRLTTDGMEGSKYWYSTQNPFYPTYGLPNCTCYAWGRFWEISVQAEQEHIPTLPTGNGGEWWGAVSGYDTGQEPQLGAVACYSQDGGLGHVAIVEEIIEGGFNTSNSGYPSSYFYTSQCLKSNGYLQSSWMGSDWHFQGFIYNPFACGGGNVPPTKYKKKMPLYMYLFI